MERYNQVSDSVRMFFAHVFGWMSVGLTVTAATSWYIFYQKPDFLAYLMQSLVSLLALVIIQFGLVFWFSSSILTLSFGTALGIFLLYAALNGMVLSRIFFTYTQESIALTFGITAALFFVMALFGFFTRLDLRPIGVFGYMTLWGLIIALLVNMYFQSRVVEMLVSGVGVILFSALTAYDMQELQLYAGQLRNGYGNNLMYQVALMGALKLYLDVINLFLMLLSFTGKRRD